MTVHPLYANFPALQGIAEAQPTKWSSFTGAGQQCAGIQYLPQRAAADLKVNKPKVLAAPIGFGLSNRIQVSANNDGPSSNKKLPPPLPNLHINLSQEWLSAALQGGGLPVSNQHHLACTLQRRQTDPCHLGHGCCTQALDLGHTECMLMVDDLHDLPTHTACMHAPHRYATCINDKRPAMLHRCRENTAPCDPASRMTWHLNMNCAAEDVQDIRDAWWMGANTCRKFVKLPLIPFRAAAAGCSSPRQAAANGSQAP